jgi:hypothetical protein
MFTKKALAASVSAPPAVYIEDVFSTYLYTGNGSTQTITNGIDLAGEGGLVWTKPRTSTTFNDHIWVDSARGDFQIQSNTTAANNAIDSFGFASTGYTVPNNGRVNTSSVSYASWTFRKAEKFFDVVTYTGDGTAGRTIPHNLGSAPGCIIVKKLSNADNWGVYHRSLGATQRVLLNLTNAAGANSGYWNDTEPTSTVFTVGSGAFVNETGKTFVAYLFAHDAGGFGDSGNDNVISCGSYAGNGSASGPVVTLGWEPQWLLIKRTNSTGDWQLIDNMRGFVVGGPDRVLNPNLSNAESTGTFVTPTSTGFQLNTTNAGYNASGGTYIYIAIRRGPMKKPEDATTVFTPVSVTGSANVSTGYPVDMTFTKRRNVISDWFLFDRLRGTGDKTGDVSRYLFTNTTSAEASQTNFGLGYDDNTGFSQNWWVSGDAMWINFRRAPGFFDVVAYTGDGTSNRAVAHNLSVTPELIIVKIRNTTGSWRVWSASFSNTSANLDLNSAGAPPFNNSLFPESGRNSSNFIVNDAPAVNGSGNTYIAYLFATCPGVSKVGSYTGTGTTLDIDCGFTAGSRFVLIKRTDSTGDWFVWDTARGIVSGNDPYLLLNSTAAEVTNTDYIDPLSSGFQISSTAPAAINASGGSFIFLAIA